MPLEILNNLNPKIAVTTDRLIKDHAELRYIDKDCSVPTEIIIWNHKNYIVTEHIEDIWMLQSC